MGKIKKLLAVQDKWHAAATMQKFAAELAARNKMVLPGGVNVLVDPRGTNVTELVTKGHHACGLAGSRCCRATDARSRITNLQPALQTPELGASERDNGTVPCVCVWRGREQSRV